MEQLYEDFEERIALRKSRSWFEKLSRKLRKSLIAAFDTHSKRSNKYTTSIVTSVCLATMSMLQGVSLVVRRHDAISEYEDHSKIFALVNYTRLDTLALDLGVLTEFFYAMMVVIYTPACILAGNVVMNVCWKRKPNWLSVKVMATVLNLLEQVLLLPSLLLMFSVLKYTILSTEAAMFEYGDAPAVAFSPSLAAASIVTIPVLVVLLYVNSYFFYDNMYSKRRRLVYSMRDSFVHRVHILARCGMGLCYCFLSELSRVWYRVGILLLCLLMYLLYDNHLSYFNIILNVENSSKKAIIVWAVVSYFVGWTVDSASTIVIMLLFVSPLLIALIYLHEVDLARSAGRRRNREITSEYQVELKLRSFLDELEQCRKDEQSSVHAKIEQLFNFATQNFRKCPLVPIWEALYYHHYRKDPALAVLKLSKVHISEPTLESLFFTNKIEKKVTKEPSPERMYLRYLKLLDEAKRYDESCCLQIVTVGTDVISRKVDPKKFDQCVQRLSTDIKKTADRYFRILELFPDNEEVLNLLGTFMCDVMKNSEGKTFVTKANMLKDSDARRGPPSAGLASSSLFTDQNGLLVLSCCVQAQGEIILANPKAYDLFRCTKIDLLGKSLCQFLPDEFRAIFTEALNEMVVFGQHLDSIQNLFAMILDAEGYLINSTVTVKVTTWENKPHVMLMLAPSNSTERLLLDEHYKVQAHTRLEVPGRGMNTMYIGCSLGEVYPNIEDRLKATQKGFTYPVGHGINKYVSVERVEFRGVRFIVISLQLITLSHHSTFLSSVSLSRKESLRDTHKGVRFNSEEKVKGTDTKHDLMSIESSKVMYSDAEARMKKKMDITTSLTMSTSSASVSFEVQETRKVTSSLKRTKLLLVLSFLMLAAGLTASVIFVTNILESLKSITLVRDYSARNLQILQLAYTTRSLMLSDYPMFQYDQQTLMGTMQGTTNTLNKLVDYMKGLVGKGSQEADAYMTQQKVPMWLRLEGNYDFRKMTLLDALYSYTTATSRLTSSSAPFTPLSDSYYVYRNGVSELLEAANITLHIRVQSEETQRRDNLEVIEFLLYMCVMLIVLPLALLVAPQFWLFEKQTKKIWMGIYALPREVVLEIRTSAIERLQNYFSNEVAVETPSVSKHFEKTAVPTRLWPGFLLRLSVYLGLNLAFFVTLQMVCFDPLQNIALTIPNYMFWVGMRPLLIEESLFWIRERQLYTHTDYSYPGLVREGQLIITPSERLRNSTSSISFIRKILNFGDDTFGIRSVKKSADYLDFVYVNSCGVQSMQSCEGTEGELGLSYAITEWASYVRLLRTTFVPDGKLFAEIETMERKAFNLVTSTAYAIDFYQRDAISQIDQISVQIVTQSVSFMLGLFLLYVFLYSRWLNSLLLHAKQALHIHKLLSTK